MQHLNSLRSQICFLPQHYCDMEIWNVPRESSSNRVLRPIPGKWDFSEIKQGLKLDTGVASLSHMIMT